MREVNFNTTVNFQGRNGFFKCCGLELLEYDFKQCVTIAPITSKGIPGNCNIQVPYESLPDLIEALQEINHERNGEST